jgi:hypothetical protein
MQDMRWKSNRIFWERVAQEEGEKKFLWKRNNGKAFHPAQIRIIPWQKTGTNIYGLEVQCGQHRTLYSPWQIDPAETVWKIPLGQVLTDQCDCSLS